MATRAIPETIRGIFQTDDKHDIEVSSRYQFSRQGGVAPQGEPFRSDCSTGQSQPGDWLAGAGGRLVNTQAVRLLVDHRYRFHLQDEARIRGQPDDLDRGARRPATRAIAHPTALGVSLNMTLIF
ncbi:MAG: hypothetical protein OXQ89_15165 [Rhodospirillaceae bacterium]|nr:hypothetical protein [Rhodospirillaceae bacterium]